MEPQTDLIRPSQLPFRKRTATVDGLTASELRAAAAYLGIRPARLRAELRAGRSMREIAREFGTTVAAVRRAVEAAVGR